MTNLSIYFTISDVPYTRRFATRQNVRKDINLFNYQGIIENNDLPCAYIGSRDINPSTNLSLIHLEDSLRENTAKAFIGQMTWVGSSALIPTSYFKLTDISSDVSSAETEYFYYKHVLPSSDIDPDSVVILNEDLSEVPKYSYRAERINSYDDSGLPMTDSYEESVVYSNYLNNYNPKTGESNVYYVRFESSGTFHHTLLSSEAIFSEATLDDISSQTSALKTWRKVYILSWQGQNLRLTLPKNNVVYALSLSEEGRIVIHDPLDFSDDEPWFVRATNGSFVSTTATNSFAYSVPEYSEQSFNPLEPYKLKSDEKALILRADILKLDRTNLVIDSSLYTMDISVKDQDDNLLYVFTTDSSKDGNYYTEQGKRVYRTIETDNAWIQWETEGILSWDKLNGFIQLSENWSDTYNFYVTYYYKEFSYELTSLNLNPLFEVSYEDQSYLIYVVPTGGFNGSSIVKGIHYIKINRSGQIIETSQDSSAGGYDLQSVFQTDNEYMYYDREASSTASVNALSGESILKINNSSSFEFPGRGVLLIGDNPAAGILIGYSSYTETTSEITFALSNSLSININAGAAVHLFSFNKFFTTNENNKYRWLPLTLASIVTDARPETLSVMDLREIGGVIKEDYYEQAMLLDPRSIWARPQMIPGRGQAIPGNSITVVKVPYLILEEYGGSFTRPAVEDIVRKHVAAGVLPVIIYVGNGAIPSVSSVISSSSSIVLSWASVGSNHCYNVYYSLSKDGPWIKHTSTPLEGGTYTYTNIHAIDGLSSGKRYYVSITSIDSNNIEGPKSPLVGISTKLA